jgi:hypothetical protein
MEDEDKVMAEDKLGGKKVNWSFSWLVKGTVS